MTIRIIKCEKQELVELEGRGGVRFTCSYASSSHIQGANVQHTDFIRVSFIVKVGYTGTISQF